MTARLALLAPLAYLAIFFLYPLGAIFERAFVQGEGGLSAFGTLLGDSYYLGRIWFTTWQAAASTVADAGGGAAHGLPLRAPRLPRQVAAQGRLDGALHHADHRRRDGVRRAARPRGAGEHAAYERCFGLDEPPIRLANSLWIILLAHAFYNYAIVVRIVSAFWSNVTPQLEESAAMLGAGRVRTFMHVTLPVLLPAIASSAALAFAFCFTSFGVVLVLGGPQFATLEVAVYELTAKLLRLELAAALAIVQMVFTYLFLLVYARFQQNLATPVSMVPQDATARRPRRCRRRGLRGGDGGAAAGGAVAAVGAGGAGAGHGQRLLVHLLRQPVLRPARRLLLLCRCRTSSATRCALPR